MAHFGILDHLATDFLCNWYYGVNVFIDKMNVYFDKNQRMNAFRKVPLGKGEQWLR